MGAEQSPNWAPGKSCTPPRKSKGEEEMNEVVGPQATVHFAAEKLSFVILGQWQLSLCFLKTLGSPSIFLVHSLGIKMIAVHYYNSVGVCVLLYGKMFAT